MLVKVKRKYPETTKVTIHLQNGIDCFVDPEWLPVLKKFHWYAKKSAGRYYACSKVTKDGKTTFIRMHRVIANTPKDFVCHHINGNTLDNRQANLLNMTLFDHTKEHSYR